MIYPISSGKLFDNLSISLRKADGVKDGILISPTIVDARTDITTELLSDSGLVIDESSDEMEMTFIPKYCELPEESDGYEFGMEFLEEHIEKEPSILKMCKDLLHMKLLNYLPFSYEEDEVDILCQCIIYQVYSAMDEEQKWNDLCKKNAWKREDIEKIAN